MKTLSWMLASLFCLPLLIACNDSASPPPDILPRGGWGKLVKVLDGAVGTRETPRLALGGRVYAKVVVGHVEVASGDPTVLTIESVETRDVGTWCRGDFCERDYDTWFTMIAVAEGDAEVIVRNEDGDERSLPIVVAQRHSASVHMWPDPNTGDISDGIVVDDGLVLDAEQECDFLHVRRLSLRAKDAEGRDLITHTTWTIHEPEVVEFLPVYVEFLGFECADNQTRDRFIEYEPLRLEGPEPLLWPMGVGDTTLRVETSDGFEIEIPVEATGEVTGELPDSCGKVNVEACQQRLTTEN